MPSTRDIRRRIRSVKNTAQITKAMQMVAASKMRKAQQAAIAVRPFIRLLYRIQRKATTGAIDFKHGTGTVFAGVKAAAKIPETNIGVSAKEGVYATFGGSGLRDIGMRVSTAGSFGLASGPTVDFKGPSYQISFVSQTIDL